MNNSGEDRLAVLAGKSANSSGVNVTGAIYGHEHIRLYRQVPNGAILGPALARVIMRLRLMLWRDSQDFWARPALASDTRLAMFSFDVASLFTTANWIRRTLR